MRTTTAARWIALLASGVWALSGSAAHAGDPVDGGRAIIDPTEGGSRTAFTLQIPDGATCSGDSANDSYRVNSYMVPAAVEPASVTFDGLGPTPLAFEDYDTFRQPLFDRESNSYVSAQTADALEPGLPGPIINIPEFDLAVYEPGDLPAGRYHIGIMCTLFNEVVTIWDTEIVVSDAPDDEPAQIRWRVADDTGGVGGDDTGASAPVIAALAAAASGVALLVARTRRRPRQATPAPSLEDA